MASAYDVAGLVIGVVSLLAFVEHAQRFVAARLPPGRVRAVHDALEGVRELLARLERSGVPLSASEKYSAHLAELDACANDLWVEAERWKHADLTRLLPSRHVDLARRCSRLQQEIYALRASLWLLPSRNAGAETASPLQEVALSAVRSVDHTPVSGIQEAVSDKPDSSPAVEEAPAANLCSPAVTDVVAIAVDAAPAVAATTSHPESSAAAVAVPETVPEPELAPKLVVPHAPADVPAAADVEQDVDCVPAPKRSLCRGSPPGSQRARMLHAARRMRPSHGQY